MKLVDRDDGTGAFGVRRVTAMAMKLISELGIFFLTHVSDVICVGHVIGMSNTSSKLVPENESE
jgi:hypothetical protein